MNSKNDIFKNIKFILSHTSHPGNIGSSARAIKTMGFSQLSLINPERFPHADADAGTTGPSTAARRTATAHATADVFRRATADTGELEVSIYRHGLEGILFGRQTRKRDS